MAGEKLAIWADMGRSETGTGRARPVPQKKLPYSPGRTYRHDARLAVLEVQVGGGLVQRQDAALVAEGLRQRQPHDEARQHLRGRCEQSWFAYQPRGSGQLDLVYVQFITKKLNRNCKVLIIRY